MVLIRLTRLLLHFVAFFTRALWIQSTLRVSRQPVDDRQYRTGVALRMLFVDMGGAYIKFGQWLAMRPDFLPQPYCDALRELLDEVPPFSTETAVSIIEEEIGRPFEEVFTERPSKTVASASFGQVYKLRLVDGTDVAVKVQRPELKRLVRSDLLLLSALVRLLDFSTVLHPILLRPVFVDFVRWTNEELNYRTEARYAARIRENAIKNRSSNLSVPEMFPNIFWELTTERILTLEFLHGTWMSEILHALNTGDETVFRKLEEHGFDRAVTARHVFRGFLNQVFVGGVFHADPHAGNIVIGPCNCVGWVDFGIVGSMPAKLKGAMLRMLKALSQGDTTLTYRWSLEVLEVDSHVDMKRFQITYERVLDRWINATLDPHATMKEKSFAALLIDTLKVAREFGIKLAPDIFSYYRALITLDTMLLQLDSTFNSKDEVRSFVVGLKTEEQAEHLTSDNYLVAALDYQSLFLQLPAYIDQALYDFGQATRAAQGGAREFQRFMGGMLRMVTWLLPVGFALMFLDIAGVREGLGRLTGISLGWGAGATLVTFLIVEISCLWGARRLLFGK